MAVDIADDVKSTSVESPTTSAGLPGPAQSPVSEGYYMKQSYPVQHRLPSPKYWSVTANNARLSFPPIAMDPYTYWRHLMESGAGEYTQNDHLTFRFFLGDSYSPPDDDLMLRSCHASSSADRRQDGLRGGRVAKSVMVLNNTFQW